MLALAITLLACLATGAPAAAADTEANKALIHSYYEEGVEQAPTFRR